MYVTNKCAPHSFVHLACLCGEFPFEASSVCRSPNKLLPWRCARSRRLLSAARIRAGSMYALGASPLDMDVDVDVDVAPVGLNPIDVPCRLPDGSVVVRMMSWGLTRSL